MEWVDQISNVINANAELAPLIIFALLGISGFNLPIPEDIVIFTAAGLGLEHPTLVWPLFYSLFLGALCGDLICYSLGRYFGPKLANVAWFSSMLAPHRIEKVGQFYTRYGAFTLVVGRFIPFGVRNALLIAAGLGRMPVHRFFFADLVAVGLSTGGYYLLYLKYGAQALSFVQNNQVFVLTAAGVVVFLIIATRRTKTN